MRLNSKKTKSFIYFFISILACASIVTFISFFVEKEIKVKNYKVNVNDDFENDSMINLNLGKEIINNNNLEKLVKFNQKQNNYFFNKKNIDTNIFDILNIILYKNNKFNDDPNTYKKILKYKFLNNNKEVIFNLFLTNKLIKSKKFKSYFKLIIV